MNTFLGLQILSESFSRGSQSVDVAAGRVYRGQSLITIRGRLRSRWRPQVASTMLQTTDNTELTPKAILGTITMIFNIQYINYFMYTDNFTKVAETNNICRHVYVRKYSRRNRWRGVKAADLRRPASTTRVHHRTPSNQKAAR
jgi:hypothetical protein